MVVNQDAERTSARYEPQRPTRGDQLGLTSSTLHSLGEQMPPAGEQAHRE